MGPHQDRRAPDDVLKEAERELERLAGMHPSSAEYSIVRTYLDWLALLPWAKSSRDRLDLRRTAGYSTPTITISRRSRSGSSNTWQSASSRKR